MEIFILEELEQSLRLSWAFVFKLGDKLDSNVITEEEALSKVLSK